MSTSASLSRATSRRHFLQLAAGGLVATGATAQGARPFAIWQPFTRSSLFPAGALNIWAARRRRNEALQLRRSLALAQSRAPLPALTTSGDEATLENALGSFTKTLPHDGLGRVDSAAWQALVKALETGRPGDFDAIPAGTPVLDPGSGRAVGGEVRLVNPEAAFSFSLAGGDSHAFGMPAAPAYSSARTAGEIVEVYAHALLRDVPFDDYASHPAVPAVVDALNALTDFHGPRENGHVTPRTLFRGDMPGTLDGGYISQFLLQPVPHGAHRMEQLFQVPAVGDDHMLDSAHWLNILRGGQPRTSSTFDPTPRHLASGRDLGQYVHVDFPYQAYQNAALILLGHGLPPNPTLPRPGFANRDPFVLFSIAEILCRLGEVAQLALKAAWFQKWRVHRRLRPEVFAGRVHQKLSGELDSPIHADVLDSPVTAAIHDRSGTWFLPMAYPEGSPAHPAYPAGHATIAGACTTVLKALFDGAAELPDLVRVDPATDATSLLPYEGGPLTVAGELNKLGNNIAIGRNIAGVHWRTDGHEGMLLGEKVALAAMRDWFATTGSPMSAVTFDGFDGSPVTLEL